MSDRTLTAKELTELTVGLNRLARKLWWTWNQDAQEIFQELSARGWQNLYHNAVAVLHEVSDYELRVRLQDHDFAERVQSVLKNFENYLKKQTPGHPTTLPRCNRIQWPISAPSSGFMRPCPSQPVAWA